MKWDDSRYRHRHGVLKFSRDHCLSRDDYRLSKADRMRSYMRQERAWPKATFSWRMKADFFYKLMEVEEPWE